MRSRAGPVTEISVTGLEIVPIWTLQPGYRDETFLTKQLRFRIIATKMAQFLPSIYFHFKSMRIGFISKVTRVHKATTVANDTSLCFTTDLVWFLEFHPGRPGWNVPHEQTTKFDPVTELARLLASHADILRVSSRISSPTLPGSYEEALRSWIRRHCKFEWQGKTVKGVFPSRISLRSHR